MATNERTRVKLFPTAKATDVLFYVECTNVLPKNKNPEYGSTYRDCFPHAPEDFPDHKLVFITPADDTGKQKWYFAADREAQDEYNFAFSDADIGGVKFATVERTYTIPRADFSPDTPDMGDPMPDVPDSMFGTGASEVENGPKFITEYVLAERVMGSTAEKELNSLYVFEKRVYLKRTIQQQIDYDEKFGDALRTVQRLYYHDEVVTTEDSNEFTAAQLFALPTHYYWGLQDDGTMREGRQLSSNWYAISERMVVPADVATSSRTYYTTVDYSWPAVLSDIDTDTWNRKDGGYEIYASPIFSREAYHGPCTAAVMESFSRTAPTGLTVSSLQPLPIHMSTPLFSLAIGPTLHDKLTITVNTGTDHPVYEYTAGDFEYLATNETDWPGTLIIEDSVSQFRGGYLRRTIIIDSPSPPAPPPP